MKDRPLQSVATAEGKARFEVAPPRRFTLPAILLLLLEQPGYGYALANRLKELSFGHLDRPSIYRALAQLESDGLIEGEEQERGARQGRRIYRVTPLGERILRVWMGVIKEEHDQLGHVLRRYQATGRADAVLAEVEGGWTADLGYGWSPFTPTSDRGPLLKAVDTEASPPAASDREHAARVPSLTVEGRFRLIPDRSVVLIEVRSTVGPLSFGSIGVTGFMEAVLEDGIVRSDPRVAAQLQVDISKLSSGNRLYDAELMRRVDARRFPTAIVELEHCEHLGSGNLYQLNGNLTFHGVTRMAHGSVAVAPVSESRLVITGEQVFDIRDFAIPSPTVLMLRIYPDVRVRLHAEAELEMT
ncbi:MAG: helix-turn-helix transcriptional regulator [Acidimicrobiaceae bacterium]|nr:helix-turn-helix transcriptional regulator [Acidimicrobiaceae bacterium]